MYTYKKKQVYYDILSPLFIDINNCVPFIFIHYDWMDLICKHLHSEFKTKQQDRKTKNIITKDFDSTQTATLLKTVI